MWHINLFLKNSPSDQSILCDVTYGNVLGNDKKFDIDLVQGIF